MKYNNFLIALALCVGFSSATTWTSESNSWSSWMPSMPERLTNAWNSAKATYNSFTVENMKQQMYQWAPSRLLAAFLAVVGVLLAAGYYKKDALIKMINQLTPKSPEEWQIAKKMGLAVGAVTIGGSTYAYNKYFSRGASLVRLFIDPEYNEIDNLLAQHITKGPDDRKRLIEWAKKTIEQKINAVAAKKAAQGFIDNQINHDTLNLLIDKRNNIITQCIQDTNNEEEKRVLQVIYEVIT